MKPQFFHITPAQLKNMTNMFYDDTKPNINGKLDDADTAGQWVNDHAKFTVDGASYRLTEIDGKTITEEQDVKESVKASTLTDAQKCWVLNLLSGMNMQWTIGNIPHTVQGIREFFEPLHFGTFGYDYDDEHYFAIHGKYHD